jgi:hypothetical protein
MTLRQWFHPPRPVALDVTLPVPSVVDAMS